MSLLLLLSSAASGPTGTVSTSAAAVATFSGKKGAASTVTASAKATVATTGTKGASAAVSIGANVQVTFGIGDANTAYALGRDGVDNGVSQRVGDEG